MKRFLLCSWITAVAAGHVAAQPCTPLPDMPEGVPLLPKPYLPEVPGTGIPDTACVATRYTVVFNIHVPPTVQLPGIPSPVPVQNISIATSGAFSDIPASFSYACNPPNCVFQANSISCVALTGTPQPSEEGLYDMKVAALLNVGLSIPIRIPDDISMGNYFLHVKSAGSPSCLPSATNELSWARVKVLYRELDR